MPRAARYGAPEQKEPLVVGTRGSEESRWLQGKDSNLRPSGYEPDELPLLHPAKSAQSTCDRPIRQNEPLPLPSSPPAAAPPPHGPAAPSARSPPRAATSGRGTGPSHT